MRLLVIVAVNKAPGLWFRKNSGLRPISLSGNLRSESPLAEPAERPDVPAGARQLRRGPPH